MSEKDTQYNDIGNFEFTRIIFTDKETYAKFTDKVKKDNLFLLLRCISKRFPTFADRFNNKEANAVAVCDYIHSHFCGYRVPKWVYTSSKGTINKPSNKSDEEIKADLVKEKLIKSIYKANSKDIIKMYLENEDLEEKTFIDLLNYAPILVGEDLTKLRSQLTVKAKNTTKRILNRKIKK